MAGCTLELTGEVAAWPFADGGAASPEASLELGCLTACGSSSDVRTGRPLEKGVRPGLSDAAWWAVSGPPGCKGDQGTVCWAPGV